MSRVVLSIGPAHTLRQAARLMTAHRAGSAVVVDNAHPGIGILTERDVLISLAADQNPDTEVVANHRTADVVFAAPDWTLEQAARTMISAGFRHLVVIDGGEVVGLLSMRDIVRCWSAPEQSQAADQALLGSASPAALDTH